MAPIIHDIAGVLGASLYLGSYGALQLGLLNNRGYAYPALNLLASSLMLTSLMGSFNLWSATIETSWIALSIVGLARYYFLTSGLRFSTDERQFLDAKLPGLEPYLARRVFAAGDWREAEAGTVFTEEGAPVPALVYLAEGRASVVVGGREVADCKAGALVGELGVASGSPAIATVTLTEPGRIFAVPAEALRKLMAQAPEIRIALDAGIGAEARTKLIAANVRAAAMAGLA
ncbi:cyclic nucleotide-binding domain-containing protein [Palleronia sp. KMU-117]|uniref:cyclic nucleotide-binding domain-containing protein n=1 Tax=Palleronia sp. KMU-117 TaxID=3434108 RepID=UPI003D70AF87